MNSTDLSAIAITPYLAPLSASMIEKASQTIPPSAANAAIALDLTSHVEQRIREFFSTWAALHDLVTSARKDAYSLVKEAQGKRELTTQWLIEELSRRTPGKQKPFAPETIKRWEREGLLPYTSQNHPAAEAAAAVITQRIITSPTLTNAFLPSTPKNCPQYFLQKPRWWCWRQDSPTASIVPCPIPLPLNLPRHTLLWTAWLGAYLQDSSWLRIGNLGCCRWGGTMDYEGQSIWSLTEQDLLSWGIPIGEEYRDALDNDAPLTRSTLAHTSLLVFATSRLKEAQDFPPNFSSPYLKHLLAANA